MKLVDIYSMWAGVEKRNEPFVGFTSLVCLTKEKKANLGRPWTLNSLFEIVLAM